jgi:surface protein
MADILPEMIDAGSSGGCMDDDPNFNLLPGAINEELFFVVIPGTVNCDDIGGIVLVDLVVTDQCGNTATCTSEVTVIDDAPPTPLCISGLAVILPPSGEETIWASDLEDASEDNCSTLANLDFSFSPDVNDQSIILDCSDLGEVPLEMWVTDESGNQDFCQTSILVLDDSGVCGLNPFITTWKTDNPGTSGPTEITIPTFPGETYSYDVDWENDGIFDDFGVTGDITHDYGTAGTYTVAIKGTFPRIYFNETGDKEKILSIDQWGDISWTSMSFAFAGASNLTYSASDAPDLSLVTDMSFMFLDATSFNATDLNSWDVQNVTNMLALFLNTDVFNGNISNWNVSNVTDMSYLFDNADIFNGDLSNWDVSSVTNMTGMFQRAHQFTSVLDNWDVSSVTDMSFMFYEVFGFTSDLSNWDVSNVTSTYFMFKGNNQFTSDLSNWNVSNVTNMGYMFDGASSFNSNLNGWDVSNVTSMQNMFSGASSFNSDLDNWDVSNCSDFARMFQFATDFNGNISTWNTSNNTNMFSMFSGASSFSGDISSWDVSNVNSMGSAFKNASSFNSDISGWDVSSVTGFFSFESAFENATSFDQDLGGWDISSAENMNFMLNNSGLSQANYDATLIGWESQGVGGLVLGAAGLEYCDAEPERTSLINTYSWVINGDALNCPAPGSLHHHLENRQPRLFRPH